MNALQTDTESTIQEDAFDEDDSNSREISMLLVGREMAIKTTDSIVEDIDANTSTGNKSNECCLNFVFSFIFEYQ